MKYSVLNGGNTDQYFGNKFYVKRGSSMNDVEYPFTVDQIAALEKKGVQVKPSDAVVSDELTSIRSDLEELGIKVNGRWGVERLREELDKATSMDAE